MQKVWNTAHEVKVPNGCVAELDFGLTIRLPKGYGVELSVIPEFVEKYGLSVTRPVRILRQEEVNSGFSVEIVGATEVSYVAEYQPLFYAKVVKVA